MDLTISCKGIQSFLIHQPTRINNFKDSIRVSKNVVSFHLNVYISSYDHFYFEKVNFISAYDNNIRFSKK